MKICKETQGIDFCEFCGKEVKPQRAKVIKCDLDFFHYPCKKCFAELEKEKLK